MDVNANVAGSPARLGRKRAESPAHVAKKGDRRADAKEREAKASKDKHDKDREETPASSRPGAKRNRPPADKAEERGERGEKRRASGGGEEAAQATEMNDEQIAMLLHKELNAISRRRSNRG